MKVHRNERGYMDLEVQIERLELRIRDLEGINAAHLKLNQELRKEIYYWKEKSSESESHKNLLQGYKTVINDLTRQLRKAGK